MANTTKTKKTQSNAVAQTWNEITGTMRIYGNTFEGKKKGQKFTKWSMTVPGKDEDGEYFNYYIPVKFRTKSSQEPETDGLHTIEISNAFLSCEKYENRNGEEVVQLVLVVTDNTVTE